ERIWTYAKRAHVGDNQAAVQRSPVGARYGAIGAQVKAVQTTIRRGIEHGGAIRIESDLVHVAEQVPAARVGCGRGTSRTVPGPPVIVACKEVRILPQTDIAHEYVA